jgi:hypothetical protein
LIGFGDPMLDKPDNEDTNVLAASLSGEDVMSRAVIAEEEVEEEEEEEGKEGGKEEEEDDMEEEVYMLLGSLLA